MDSEFQKKKIETARGVPINNKSAERLKRKVKNKSLKKLEKLIMYFRSTPSITEEAREILIARLRTAYSAWKKGEWESIVLSPEERKKYSSSDTDTST